MKSHVLSDGIRVSVSSKVEGCAVSFDFEGHPAYVMGGSVKGRGGEWVLLSIGSHPDDNQAASEARTHRAQLWVRIDALEELVTALRQSAANRLGKAA
jgi:hypothetical protein